MISPLCCPQSSAEVKAVDVVCKGDIDDLQISPRDLLEQRMNELRFRQHVAEQVFHAAQGPCTLEQRKPDRGHGVPITARFDERAHARAYVRLIHGRKTIFIEFIRIADDDRVDHANVLVGAGFVPDHAEFVPKTVAPERYLRLDQVHVCDGVIQGTEVIRIAVYAGSSDPASAG